MAEQWWWSWTARLRPYAVLLHLFIEGTISADEFEVIFLRLYLRDPTAWDDDMFDVIDGLFASVDDYCGDDQLRAQVGGIDGGTLRQVAEDTFRRLEKLGELPPD